MKFFKYIIAVPVTLFIFAETAFLQPIEVDRVEPANWWIGFQNPFVQILIYGKDIQKAEVSIAYPGVSLERTTLVKNPNYMFLTLRIGEKAEPGSVPITLSTQTDDWVYDFEIQHRNYSSGRNQGFNSSDLIYLLMPDRFANGNPENDEIEGMLEGVDRKNPNARHGGDIQGIADHLDYIKNLGMTAVWFTPILENDMPSSYGAYHGYAATDLYRVDRRFGSNEEYLNLIEKAHDMDMKVIMDMIHNHVGLEHWFVKDQPTTDWIHDLNEKGTTNFRTSTVMDPYASKNDLSSTVQGWFVVDMPDLDQRNELVSTYLIQNTIWWIEYSGIDGIRMDTHPYPYKEYMAEWARRILDEYPNFNIVGEAWMPNVPSTAYWQTGFPSSDGYESYLPSVTDFPFANTLRSGLNEGDGWDTGLTSIYDIISQDFLYPDPMLNVIFTGNHDLDRIFSSLGEDPGKLKLAYALTLTTRGIPQVYYGDEILITGAGPDGLKRKDFPGGWSDDSINAFTESGRVELDAETDQPVVEVYEFVKTLSNWRHNKKVIHTGGLTHFIPQNNVYVYFRHNESETVMVVLNGSDTDQSISLDRYSEFLNGVDRARNIFTDEMIFLDENLRIPSRDPVILEW